MTLFPTLVDFMLCSGTVRCFVGIHFYISGIYIVLYEFIREMHQFGCLLLANDA